MPDKGVGEEVVFHLRVIDLNNQPVTGLTAGHFTATLQRRGTSSFAAASEPLTFEDAGGGTYAYRFTLDPDAGEKFYELEVAEKDTIPLGRLDVHRGWWTVGATSLTYTEDDAFCSVADVEARWQRGAFMTAAGNPTREQVLDFMAWRALELEAVLSAHGQPWTVPSGERPLSGASGRLGRVLPGLLRDANVLGAAGDALHAAEVHDSDEETSRAGALWKQYEQAVERLSIYLTRTAGASVRSHLATGGVARSDNGFAPSGTKEREASEMFDLGREW